MGNDAIFGPFKAGVQAACGEADEAKDTMKRFNGSNPAVLAVRACYHMAKGGEKDSNKGKALGSRGLKNTANIVEGVVNGIPVVGHAKGLYHYARDERNRGDSAMKSASRSTAGVVGAVAGFAAGSVPGAVAGYVGGVNAADGVTSGVESAVHGKMMLNGNLATCHTACSDPSVANVFDAALGVGIDVAAAMAAGSGLGDTLSVDTVDAPDLSIDPSGVDACVGDPADVGLGDAVDTRQGAWSGEVDLNSGKAAGTVSDTLDNLAEAVKDDLKLPDGAADFGTTVEARVTSLENMSTTDGVQWAALPDNKRDWIQEID